MPFYFFIWDGENDAHIAEHDVGIEEVQEVVCGPTRLETSDSSGRPIAFGWTSTGRFLACVYELLDEDTVYPISAYEVEP